MLKNYADERILTDLLAVDSQSKKAEQHLFNKYKGLLSRGMKKHFLSKSDSLNCYIDAFTDLVIKVRKKKFDLKKPITPILTKIFDHKCIDQIRKNTNLKNKRTAPIDELLQLGSWEKSPLAELVQLDIIDFVQQNLQKMGGNCKELISLWAMSYSHKEIASLLPNLKNSNSSKSMLNNCLKKLRQTCSNLV